jgi:hypothetical protein
LKTRKGEGVVRMLCEQSSNERGRVKTNLHDLLFPLNASKVTMALVALLLDKRRSIPR